mgnify:CR=1 FL=1
MKTDTKRIAIFGAGQAGRMVRTWLPATQELLCFIDNDKEKQGKMMDGLPVLSLEEALQLQPHKIILAILNVEAEQRIRTQIEAAGFTGVCTDLGSIRAIQDVRMSALRLHAREIEAWKIPGDVAELGVYQGAFAAEINRLFPERRLWLFDTFEGFHARDLAIEEERTGVKTQRRSFADTTIELVRSRLPHPEMARFVKGYFPESLDFEVVSGSDAEQGGGDEEIQRAPQTSGKNVMRASGNGSAACEPQHEDRSEPCFALVSLDPDLYEPTLEGLRYFYPRLTPGGRILIHDYTSCQFEGVKMAVDEYCRVHGLFVVPLMDLHGTAVLVKV